MADKPGITTLDAAGRGAPGAGRDQAHLLDHVQRAVREPRDRQGRRARARPGRSARWSRRSASGRIAMTPKTRPAWFFDKRALRRHPVRHRLAPGRPVPVLHRLDARRGRRRRRSATCITPQYPKFEDFGDVMLRGDGGTGYIRVDWFTPGRPGDLGRRPPDDPRHRRLHRDAQERRHRRPAGRQPPVPRRPEGDALHRLHATCALPYGRQLVDDIVNRTETAMTQAHCFLATELVLEAQKQAQRVDASQRNAVAGSRGRVQRACMPDGASTSRRDFMAAAGKGAVAASVLGGFPAIVPASVLGSASPGNRINIGAIGIGRISRGHDLPGTLEARLGPDHGRVRSRQPPRRRTRRRSSTSYYTKQTGQAVRRRHDVRRLPRAARQQGHRRGRDQHAGPLARAHRDPRRRSRQGRLPAEAGVADDRRGARAERRRPAHRPHLPDRQPAALVAAVPLCRASWCATAASGS